METMLCYNTRLRELRLEDDHLKKLRTPCALRTGNAGWSSNVAAQEGTESDAAECALTMKLSPGRKAKERAVAWRLNTESLLVHARQEAARN
jgi:hypothetical protein